MTSTFVLRGRRGTKLASTVVLRVRRGTHGTGWRPWAGIWRRGAAPLCVAGVAQPDIHLRFTWQAWHKLTSTVVLRGRRGTYGTGWRPWAGIWRRGAAPLCVAGVGQPDIHLRFTWQAWHNLTSTFVSRGRRGTYGTGWRPWAGIWRRGAAPLWVAGVAQPHIHLRFTWQAWHNLTSTVVLRVRRGTYGTGWRPWAGIWRRGAAPLCVAGVAQPDIHLRFTWQAWHNLTSTVVLRGRRGTYGTGWRPWAGIWRRGAAPHFGWQAWHNLTSTFVSRGRRGTISHLPSFCVAGVALVVLGGTPGLGFGAGAPRHFAWQAWHNLTSTFVSRGRRGTISHLPSFCVAGVALMVLGGALGPGFGAGAPRHFAWQAWHNLTSTFVSRGRRGTISHLPSFCVAGVALMVLGGALGPGFGAGAPRHFAWQAWHNLTSTFVSRGRRGTISHLPSFCVAGVALMVLGGALGPGFGAGAPRHFAWQAWHNLTSTFVSRGRRGTISHLPSFCVAGVALMVLYIHIYVRTHIHTYMHACMHAYIHTYILPTVLPSRSFTTSFVFPFFPVPAKTIEAHFRKKLTCGVIRSFNLIATRRSRCCSCSCICAGSFGVASSSTWDSVCICEWQMLCPADVEKKRFHWFH